MDCSRTALGLCFWGVWMWVCVIKKSHPSPRKNCASLMSPARKRSFLQLFLCWYELSSWPWGNLKINFKMFILRAQWLITKILWCVTDLKLTSDTLVVMPFLWSKASIPRFPEERWCRPSSHYSMFQELCRKKGVLIWLVSWEYCANGHSKDV